MRELLVATSNKGKLTGMLSALHNIPFKILTLADVESGPDVEETGTTLEQNAILKAKTHGERTGNLTVAEDTGLEVDALGGGPGVRTARYAEGSDDDRNRKLLQEMKDVPDERRGAQFHTVAAMFDPVTQKVITTEGVCKGHILKEMSETPGFGFSPLFFVDEVGKPMSELDTLTRDAVTHRGKALEKMRELLLAEFH